MHRLRQLLNPEWWRFEWRYWRRRTPWDTHTTPPEVMEYLQQATAGRALDLGCGTGTNAIALTRHGWQTVGVDFSPKAIAAARRKAAREGFRVDFHVGDVSDLAFLSGPFDYALDIGCMFTLQPDRKNRYAAEVARLLRPGADFMLYAWLPQQRRGRQWGISTQQVADLLTPYFNQTKMVTGKDGPGASAWYWLVRK